MNFLAKVFSFFNKPKSKSGSKSTQLKLLLSSAEKAEKSGEMSKALDFYKEAMSELETTLKHKMEEKYYRSKYSEIRFIIDKLKGQIDESSEQVIKLPLDSKKPKAG